MRNPDHGWEPPPRRQAPSPPPRPVSAWDPPPTHDPGSGPAAGTDPWRRKPPWYRRAWFVSLVVVALFGAAGAVAGSQVP
jgi:hypothetical protein